MNSKAKINYRRLNIQTSEQVDDMFREQSALNGMTMSEYFKHLVVSRNQGMQLMKTFEEQLKAIPLIKDKE